MIKLSERAAAQLNTRMTEEKYLPRVDADIAGGCGLSVRFTLIFDEPRGNDTVIDCDGIQIRMDRFTKRYLHKETHIDYLEEHGFLIGESFTANGCAIEMNG